MKPYLQDADLTLYHGDVLAILRELPAESVDCVVTSPPYWGLRNYGVDGQIGMEATPDCDRRGLYRLRSDLTDEQREYVARRLLDAETLGA